jgi:hypothetical protein
MNVRGYADKPTGEFDAQYQRGSPQGFAKKEQVSSSSLNEIVSANVPPLKAQENQYMQQMEKEKLKARECRDDLAQEVKAVQRD